MGPDGKTLRLGDYSRQELIELAPEIMNLHCMRSRCITDGKNVSEKLNFSMEVLKRIGAVLKGDIKRVVRVSSIPWLSVGHGNNNSSVTIKTFHLLHLVLDSIE